MTTKLKVTYKKSRIGGTQSQKATIRSLGFKRLNDVRILEDSPVVRGMLNKVNHLVSVEEVAQ